MDKKKKEPLLKLVNVGLSLTSLLLTARIIRENKLLREHYEKTKWVKTGIGSKLRKP